MEKAFPKWTFGGQAGLELDSKLIFELFREVAQTLGDDRSSASNSMLNLLAFSSIGDKFRPSLGQPGRIINQFLKLTLGGWI